LARRPPAARRDRPRRPGRRRRPLGAVAVRDARRSGELARLPRALAAAARVAGRRGARSVPGARPHAAI